MRVAACSEKPLKSAHRGGSLKRWFAGTSWNTFSTVAPGSEPWKAWPRVEGSLKEWEKAFLHFVLRGGEDAILGDEPLALEVTKHTSVNRSCKTLDIFLSDVTSIVKAGTREG